MNLKRFVSYIVIASFCVLHTQSIRITDNRQRTKHKFQGNATQQKIHVGAILPFTSLTTSSRAYHKSIKDAITSLYANRNFNFQFPNFYHIVPDTPHLMMPLSASPTDILNTTCELLLYDNIVTILYFTNAEQYGINAASAQYLLQLTGYLGIPVIAWNADNVGLEQSQRVSESKILQLAPSVEHQARAMLSILKRYSWHSFAVVTSQVGGHDDFIRAVRDLVQKGIYDFRFDILDVVILNKDHNEYLENLEGLANSEARIILLFATRSEASHIMAAAKALGIAGKHYVWICSQSVVGPGLDTPPGHFPSGMLGIYVNSTHPRLLEELKRAVTVFGFGLEAFVKDQRYKTLKDQNLNLNVDLSCAGNGPTRWMKGDILFRYMRNVNTSWPGGPDMEFNLDGTLKHVELEIMNLNKRGMWERIGEWTKDGLDIKDIIWPGDSPVPPPGVPEKFNLRVTFLEEPPYVNLLFPDNETGECKTRRSVKCRVAPEQKFAGINHTMALRNPDYYKCCSGFCIDLLKKFSEDLKFNYELYRVEDGKWGALSNGTWNGLIADVLNNKADIVVTSIKINSERQSAADFTIPFLETGIAIVVAKRTGIISPKAFLEPFDTISWVMILFVCIQAAAVAIFLFEWLSPYGYDMKMLPPREGENDNKPDHKFSLFRTYWLVWAILFGAAVNVDCPRGYTARFMSSVWAMFAVVFLAIYTANLAAFMITREEYYDLQGIEDRRLTNPTSVVPPFRFGTIPHGNTEAVLSSNKPEMHRYMKNFNRTSVREGVRAVKNGNLDAFIYDATVLEYLVGQDNECRLLTVGTWYAMTGYGFALPKKSKYLGMFNKAMIQYRENGDLERLQRFWLQGACKPKARKRNFSKPLDVNQFMSAFLLLGIGIVFTIVVLVLEHIYFRYVRKHLAKKDAGGCFTLISLSMGKSLSFRGAVYEATELLRTHRCKDPVCDSTLWKTRHELDLAKIKIQQLQDELQGKKTIPSYEVLKTRDMTKNYITTNEIVSEAYKTHPLHPYGPHFIKTVTTPADVAEIETVL